MRLSPTYALTLLVVAATGCAGPPPADETRERSAGAEHGSEGRASTPDEPDETATDETSTDETQNDETATGETESVVAEPDETETETETGETAPTGSASPDARSSTPSAATYTRCGGADAGACEDCGLTVNVRRTRGWRAGEYRFELLTEGNHIRCAVTLPCDSPEPVACRASPGAPQVEVLTEGCGGEGRASIAALLFPADACPRDVRVEGFRDGIGAGSEDLTLRYADRCDGACQGRSATFTLIR